MTIIQSPKLHYLYCSPWSSTLFSCSLGLAVPLILEVFVGQLCLYTVEFSPFNTFWGEALASYIHVGNRLPTSAIPGATTPYELWHGTKPDVSHLRVWGCTAYV